MPTASREVRKKRRLKRELTLAYRLLDITTSQRDQMKRQVDALFTELKKVKDQSTDQPSSPHGKVASILEKDKNLSPDALDDYTTVYPIGEANGTL